VPKLLSRLAAWTFPLTATRIVGITFVLALAALLLSFIIDDVLVVSESPRRCFTAMYVTNFLLSIFVGLLFWTRSTYLRKRLEVIAGLNHNVRNALYVLSLSTSLEVPDVHIIRECVDKIDSALREFVPQ
jgi:hypothetical protein